MSEADWHRAGTHSESGPYTVEDWLEIYAAHADERAAQITRALKQAELADRKKSDDARCQRSLA